MIISELHPWPKGQSDALRIQNELRNRIILDGSLDGIGLIAGVDTAFDHTINMLYAAVCVMSYPDLIEREKATASATAGFPYIPGLHAFREGPVILKAMSRLKTEPDVVLFAGHGIAHPRRLGLASHLGLVLDIPAVGCARKLLIGRHDDLAEEKGAAVSLVIGDQEVGKVYRSRDHVKPIYISPGYRCTVDQAVRLVINCLGEYRVPEPLRAAHRLANRVKRNNQKGT